MAFDRLLSTDRAMRLRLSRQLMGFGSYLMFLVPGTLAVDSGWAAFGYGGLLTLVVAITGANLLFFTAIRSGWSLRFRDPTLLVPQILVALAFAILTIHYMHGEARSVMLMLFVAIFFFGLFSLTTREFLRIAALAIAGYVGLMVYEFHGRALDTPAFRAEVLRLVALIMMTVWLSFIGGYFASLRSKLGRRKVALQDALARVKDLSERDELTGARNRRYLMQALEVERARGERFGPTFAIAIIDIDHFKRFNDAHGHHVGDEILRGFCDRVRRQARELDLLARQDVDLAFGRYGGEEFLLLLPHTGPDGAARALERLRVAVDVEPFPTSAGPLRVTFSAGIAGYRRGEPIADVLARADAALYAAKSAGRNRVEMAPEH